MPVIRDPESKYSKELELWNLPKRAGGHGPDGFQEYPQMLYHAWTNENQALLCGDPVGEASPDISRAIRAEAFTRSCQRIVRSEGEHAQAEREGWRTSAALALAHVLSLQEAISTAAAEEQHRLKRMGDVAKREFEAAEQATSEHVADLPAPKRRPGRPARTKVAA